MSQYIPIYYNPQTFWKTFRQFLIEDYLSEELTDDEIIQRALRQTQAILIIDNGLRLTELGLEEPTVRNSLALISMQSWMPYIYMPYIYAMNVVKNKNKPQ